MFSFGQNKKKPEEEEVHVEENMLISDLPANLSNDFVEIFNSVNSFSDKDSLGSTSEMDSSLKKVKEDIKKTIFGPLKEHALLLDENGDRIYSMRQELKNSESDLKSSSSTKDVPTPFIKHFVERLNLQFIELDESIQSVGSYLSSCDNNENVNPVHTIAESLKSEHEAVIRCGTKVSKLKTKFDSFNSEFNNKSKIKEESNDVRHISRIDTKQGIADKIEIQYDSFVSDKHKKLQERMEKINLFGGTFVPTEAPAKSAFGSSFSTTKKPVTTVGSVKPSSSNPPPGAKQSGSS